MVKSMILKAAGVLLLLALSSAAEAASHGCEGLSPEACRQAVVQEEIASQGNIRDESRFYAEACHEGEALACALEADKFVRLPRPRVEAEEIFVTPLAGQKLSHQCETGDGWACVGYGLLLQAGVGVKKDDDEAIGAFDRSCKLGNQRGCLEYTLGMLRALGTVTPPPSLFALMKEACAQGNGESCNLVGAEHFRGRVAGLKVSYSTAMNYFQRSCSLGHAEGCSNIGVLLEHGFGVKKSLAQATAYYERACNNGSGAGCLNLSYLYLYGRGHRVSPEKAELYGEKGCKMGFAVSCTVLGYAYERGDVIPPSREQAMLFFERGCVLKDAHACIAAAEYHAAAQAPEGALDSAIPHEAEYYYRLAFDAFPSIEALCRSNEGESCSTLGLLYQRGAAGLPKRSDRAFALLERGCRLGWGAGCEWKAAALLVLDGNRLKQPIDPQVPGLVERACELGRPIGCHLSAALYHDGVGVEKSAERAAQFLSKGCDLGLPDSCYGRGRVYFESGIKREEAANKALKYFTRACDLGNANACAEAGLGFELKTPQHSLAKALEYNRRGCEGQVALACLRAGVAFQDGKGTEKSIPDAADYLARACELDNADACITTGSLFFLGEGIEQSNTLALKFYERGCTLKDHESCNLRDDLLASSKPEAARKLDRVPAEAH
jgi:uncharacterized protein